VNCFQLLGLPDQPTPSAAEVKQAWRLAASRHHPDRGGNAVEFDRLRRAYEEALAEAERPRLCPTCDGSGSYLKVDGWASIKLLCMTCGGTGLAP
jgi:DnaJ-class molecular chaperone